MGNVDCGFHTADYVAADGVLSLPELLRVVQVYNGPAYTPCEEGLCICGAPVFNQPGDADNDGCITIVDAFLVQRFLDGNVPALARPGLADADERGSIDAADVTAMQERVAAL